MITCTKCKRTYSEDWTFCATCLIPLPKASSQEVTPSSDLSQSHSIPPHVIQTELIRLKQVLNECQNDIRKLESQLTSKTPISPEPPKEKSAFIVSNPTSAQTPTPVAHRDTSAFPTAIPQPATPPRAVHSKETPPPKAPTYKAKKKTFEETLGRDWFNKLGIFAVVIGIVLLIGYSFQYFGPWAKLGTGVAAACGLLGLGIFLEQKRDLEKFAKSLMAGGWALLYFTTYAAHHLEVVRVIPDPTWGFVALLVVALAAILHLQRYNSQTLTTFTYLLIYVALIITPMTLYTTAISLLTAASLMYFVWTRKWNDFALYGMFMSYLTVMTLGHTPASTNEFYASTGVLLSYWLIFVCAGLTMNAKDDRVKALLPFTIRDILFLGNSALSSLCFERLLDIQAFRIFKTEVALLSFIAYGILSIVLYRKACKISFRVVSTFALIYLAFYLNYQLEGVQLVLAHMILLTALSAFGVWGRDGYWRAISAIGLVVVACNVIFIDSNLPTADKAFWFGWSQTAWLMILSYASFLLNQMLYHFVLWGKYHINEKGTARVFSYTYTIIFIWLIFWEVPPAHQAMLCAIYGASFWLIGQRWNHLDSKLQGLAVLSISLLQNIYDPLHWQKALASTLLIEVAWFIGNILRENHGYAFRRWHYLLPASCGLIYVNLIQEFCPLHLKVLALGGLGMTYLVIDRLRGQERTFYGWIAALVFLFGSFQIFRAFMGLMTYFYSAKDLVRLYHVLFLILHLLATRVLANRPQSEWARRILYTSFLLGLFSWTLHEFDGVLTTTVLGGEGIILLLLGFVFTFRFWRLLGMATLVFTLSKIFVVDLRHLETIHYIFSLILLGLILLLVSFVYNKFRAQIQKYL